METIALSWKTKDGLIIAAQQYCPPMEPKAAICLVHGLGEHSRRYQHVAQAFTDAGFAMLSYDLRGHGRSEGLRGHSPSFECLYDDIELALRQTNQSFPGKPIFLYGHSFGGEQVLDYVLSRYPKLIGVIVTSPGLQASIEPAAWKKTLGNMLYNLWPTFQMGNGLEQEGLSTDQQVVQAYRDDPLVHDRVSARMGLDLLSHGPWAIEHAAEFDLPLLLMHGTADRIASFPGCRSFAEKVHGDITFIPWEGGYHELHNSPEKKLVLDTMIQWMNDHLAD